MMPVEKRCGPSAVRTLISSGFLPVKKKAEREREEKSFLQLCEYLFSVLGAIKALDVQIS